MAPQFLAGFFQRAHIDGDAGNLPGVEGEALLSVALGPDLMPGLYQGEDRSLARNVVSAESVFEPAAWPERVTVEGLSRPAEVAALANRLDEREMTWKSLVGEPVVPR